MISKISLAEAPRAPFDLEAYIMHTSSTLEVIHLILQPGQVIPQHSNPVDVIVCLVEGEVILCTGDYKSILALYEVAEVNKNTDRGFTNNGASIARLLIMKKL
jgi:quercetin dioxygenase-like cupin family protein